MTTAVYPPLDTEQPRTVFDWRAHKGAQNATAIKHIIWRAHMDAQKATYEANKARSLAIKLRCLAAFQREAAEAVGISLDRGRVQLPELDELDDLDA